jgi:4-hydroxy-3-methylbut-2-enyl diphosphate reductase
MVDSARDLEAGWIAGKACVGVTAGASAPEVLVQEVVARLQELGADQTTQLEGIEEKVVFPLPRDLA